MLNIHPANAFRDNYIWIIHNQNYAVVIDPGIATPVIEYLQLKKLQLCAILITHHHNDHTGGIVELIKLSDIPVYGPGNESIATISNPVQQNDIVSLQEISLNLTVLDTPGHTRGHIAYYGSNPWNMIFCGDTLFSCGCGRIFEGSAAQLYQSLQKISQLPEDTLIYCAHEYTLGNIQFARTVDPENRKLNEFAITAQELRHKNTPTIPATLALEKAINPFLRCDHQQIINSAQNYSGKPMQNPENVFAVLREWKNKF
ncbi:hydroxyacylglutathione hydrolase [Nitrosomonas supralitoralis]|uniref:Hydroxyacylglutathione hydrolase n=1 Tax=Nitrosomonas supralitoralis TaxID=2116706 RepID=A0A2P7NXQ9_9PROT|nr:hydroxyacylglutathione hydrolase [Nitrosomonas supralitoralis]PSJ18237.1 hydroxyacylglutathione hydrolase [Nitrosomonas supralitoralis]